MALSSDIKSFLTNLDPRPPYVEDVGHRSVKHGAIGLFLVPFLLAYVFLNIGGYDYAPFQIVVIKPANETALSLQCDGRTLLDPLWKAFGGECCERHTNVFTPCFNPHSFDAQPVSVIGPDGCPAHQTHLVSGSADLACLLVEAIVEKRRFFSTKYLNVTVRNNSVPFVGLDTLDVVQSDRLLDELSLDTILKTASTMQVECPGMNEGDVCTQSCLGLSQFWKVEMPQLTDLHHVWHHTEGWWDEQTGEFVRYRTGWDADSVLFDGPEHLCGDGLCLVGVVVPAVSVAWRPVDDHGDVQEVATYSMCSIRSLRNILAVVGAGFGLIMGMFVNAPAGMRLIFGRAEQSGHVRGTGRDLMRGLGMGTLGLGYFTVLWMYFSNRQYSQLERRGGLLWLATATSMGLLGLGLYDPYTGQVNVRDAPPTNLMIIALVSWGCVMLVLGWLAMDTVLMLGGREAANSFHAPPEATATPTETATAAVGAFLSMYLVPPTGVLWTCARKRDPRRAWAGYGTVLLLCSGALFFTEVAPFTVQKMTPAAVAVILVTLPISIVTAVVFPLTVQRFSAIVQQRRIEHHTAVTSTWWMTIGMILSCVVVVLISLWAIMMESGWFGETMYEFLTVGVTFHLAIPLMYWLVSVHMARRVAAVLGTIPVLTAVVCRVFTRHYMDSATRWALPGVGFVCLYVLVLLPFLVNGLVMWTCDGLQHKPNTSTHRVPSEPDTPAMDMDVPVTLALQDPLLSVEPSVSASEAPSRNEPGADPERG